MSTTCSQSDAASQARCPRLPGAGVSLAPWRIKRAQTLMSELMNKGCSIEHVARECAISRSHFSRAFKNSTGLSPHHWLRLQRVRKAEQLLLDGQMSLQQVALECGFYDQSYFTRVFSKVVGLSPRRWQIQNAR